MKNLTIIACLTVSLITSVVLTGCGSSEPVTTTATTTTRSTSVEPVPTTGASTTTVVRRSGGY